MMDLLIFTGDLAFEIDDFKIDRTLKTAIAISLFTDERDDGQNGWWGGKIGSKLWKLRRAKKTPETLELATRYAREAIEWVEIEGFGKIIDVSSMWEDPGALVIKIQIKTETGLLVWDFSDLNYRSLLTA